MGPQTYTGIPAAHTPVQPRRGGLLRRGWRKMTWALIAWSTLVVIGCMATAGHTSNPYSSACQQALGNDGGLYGGGAGSLCQQAGRQVSNQVAASQLGHILTLGVVGFVILSIIWFMTRPKSQPSA